MALHRIIKTYKNGDKIDQIIHNNTTVHIYKPEADVISTIVQCFKYHVKGMMNPAIIRFKDKTIIGPYNIECHPMTTLNDIVWERPETKQNNVTTITESESSQSKYKTTYNPNNNTFKCNCFGYFRAKDRQCKHIKALKEKIK